MLKQTKNAETKENSQRRPNNNNLAIKQSQGLQFLLKSNKEYSEPYPLSCLVDTETPATRKKLTT